MKRYDIYDQNDRHVGYAVENPFATILAAFAALTAVISLIGYALLMVNWVGVGLLALMWFGGFFGGALTLRAVFPKAFRNDRRVALGWMFCAMTVVPYVSFQIALPGFLGWFIASLGPTLGPLVVVAYVIWLLIMLRVLVSPSPEREHP